MNNLDELENPEPAEATPGDYLELARELNKIAGDALRLETKDANPLAAKVSIGLSLQAAELVGKGMLRSLGHSVKKVKDMHGKHNVLMLLRDVEKRFQSRAEASFAPYHHFLLWAPTIDGAQYGNTIAAYFELHFGSGPSAHPRNYFYPDEATFTAPVPIHAMYVMVQHLIEIGERVLALSAQ